MAIDCSDNWLKYSMLSPCNPTADTGRNVPSNVEAEIGQIQV